MQFRQAEGQIPQELPQEQGDQALPSVPVIPIWIDVMEVEKPDEIAHVKITYPEGRPITVRKAIADGIWQELLGKLRGRLRDHPEDKTKIPVAVRSRAKATWRHTLNAFYQAKQAGFDIVTFP